ncbi:MAG TPA: hypothetical protein VNS32_18080, partial [Flavisolibacter sp.]|nr:hypothetical protein [Flavisolibacter sp.]
MKTILPSILILFSFTAYAQITTPIIKAAFGVDGDLKSNNFNGFVQSGNDDWFTNGTVGTGQYVIDTTGAAAIRAAYTSNAATRMQSFFRTMSKPSFTVVNNRL